MHKGRTYPHHPVFWVTEKYFWPGYMPWKLSWTSGNLNDATHDFLGVPPYPVISQPGVVTDPHQIMYEWPITWPADCDLLQIIVFDAIRFVDQKWVNWHAVGSLAGETQQEAWLSIDEPQFDPSISGDWVASLDSGFQPVTGTFSFVPATYAQGGSPWP